MRPGSRWRRLLIGRAQLGGGEAFHHGAVLAVTVPAAALLLAAVLDHHVVVAAVVAEDAAAESTKDRRNVSGCVLKKPSFFWDAGCTPAVMPAQPPGELVLTAQAVSGFSVRQPPTLLRSQFLLKLQRIRLLPQGIFVPEEKGHRHRSYVAR